MLGIFIGIAAVVSLISLGEGLQTAITGQFSTLGPDKLIVQSVSTGFGPPGAGAVRKLTDRDVRLLEGVSGVRQVISRLVRVVEIDYNKIALFKYVASLPEEQDKIDEIYATLNLKTGSGRLLIEQDRRKVVLGDDFISNVEFGRPLRVGSKLSIQNIDFEIVGFVQRASSFQINSAILMPERDLREILSLGDEHDLLVVQIEDSNLAQEISEAIMQRLRKDRGLKPGEEDFSVQTPLQALESINTILNVINLVVGGIAAISLLVGGIGITNTMYTSVLERTREIGIMKAVGARNQDILLLFLIEAGLLGLVGGVIGVGMGFGLAFGVASIISSVLGGLSLSIDFSLSLALGAFVFSMGVGTIAGIIPAIQASRLKTVEALTR
jgi:putative ABC transport system permease protein